ncbi:MAG: hypothetical protein NZ908_00205 [Candidatus Micrarchaeota archaeon]|nr:hypothetical protein [Candidatus Micrarchaeota archaeon]MCX8154212.1 hypothetical protein [Candidatus Micrarchaeota archaeon]
MRAQVGIEVIMLAGVILMLSLMAIASFLAVKQDIQPSSASVYEFYNRVEELKRISYHNCQRFRAEFTHDFGDEVEFYNNSNYLNGSIGTVYFQNVTFFTNSQNSQRGRSFKFFVNCSAYQLQVSIR